MTVAIDPSDVRRQAAGKRPLAARRWSLVVGALGGVGLIAFTYGAFSFFSGLADPRVRNPRPATIAANMPDLKDGLPALVSDKPTDAKPTILNLPKPPAPGAPAASEAARTEPYPDAPQDAPPSAVPPRAAESTGSLVATPTAGAKPGPAIENAATVAANPRQAALIGPAKLASPLAPAKAETVRAKAVETRNAALPAPTPNAEARNATAAVKPAASAKPVKPKLVKAAPEEAEAPSAPPPVAHASAADESDSLGAKLQNGIKAIGGVFGGGDE